MQMVPQRKWQFDNSPPLSIKSIEIVRRSPRQIKRHLSRRALSFLITFFITRFKRANLQKGVSSNAN
jgi:hypothetical protein